MSNEPHLNLPARPDEQHLPERYRQPSALTKAGQQDRSLEQRHALAVRDRQRQAIEYAVDQAAQRYELESHIEEKGAALTSWKWREFRNEWESNNIANLAGENPVLRAKFAAADDDYYASIRRKFIDWG